MENIDDQGDSPFEAEGVLGLAPGGAVKTYINGLKRDGVIDREVVGLNLEDPRDTDRRSSLDFGAFDFS